MATQLASPIDDADATKVSRKQLREAKMLTSPDMVKEIMSRPLPDCFRDRQPRMEPVKGLQYAKPWNTMDFLGKYHTYNFKNQSYPTPGTNILEEQRARKLKNDDLERFASEMAEREGTRRNRLNVRTENALIKTRIALGSTIGKPMEDAEEVLRIKQRLVENKPLWADTRKEIARFFKNVTSGNENYIVFCATLGFKSFNFQDEQTGDSVMHIAVRSGHLKMVQELLKYTCDPNLRNNLGDTPIHEAWFHWHPVRFNRTREERLEQEKCTYEMILAILSYGGSVDSANQRGETALHIASRMGTPQIILLLLGFQSNVNMRDTDGRTAAEVAEHHGRREMSKLFAIWEAIRHRYVHADFLSVWRAFLRDAEAVISADRPVEDVIFDLNMAMDVAKVERTVRAQQQGEVIIDDTLMRQTYQAMRNADAEAPKPWDPAWHAFVADSLAHGAHALLDEEQLAMLSTSHSPAEREKEKQRLKEIAKAESDAGLTRAQVANKRLPDRVMPEARPRTRQDADARSRAASRSRRRGSSSSRSRSDSPLRESISARPGSKGRESFGMLPPIDSPPHALANRPSSSSSRGAAPLLRASEEAVAQAAQVTQRPFTPLDDDAPRPLSSSRSSLSPLMRSASFIVPEYRPLDADHVQRAVETASEERVEESVEHAAAVERHKRPTSAMQLRRRQAAKTVALDAKFFRFTRRPATASALFIPLRTPTAPLYGTDEQKSIMRHITMQGKEFELAAKNAPVDIRARLGFEVKEPHKSFIGDYTEAVSVEINGERDRLYNMLNVKPMSEREAIEAAMLAAEAALRASGKGAKEAAVQEKVAMVQDKRLRFIEEKVIPPERKLMLVERMALERQAKEDEERKQRLGLSGDKGDAARAELAQSLLAPVDEDKEDEAEDDPALRGDGIIEQNIRRRRERERQKKRARGAHLLARQPIKYGKGRLQSTHNLKGAIESPWSTTSGRFKPRSGDRTF